MIFSLILLPLVLASEIPAPVDNKATPDWLLGNWSGKGSLFGQPAHMSLTVCPLAGNRGLTLDYQVKGEGRSTMQFAGHADYVPDGENRWRGQWTGSNGVDHDLSALVSKDSFTATWHNAAVETGRTHYQRTGPEQLRVTDYVLRENGRFEQFARADYDRKIACPGSPNTD
ncbi:MAG: hypothetical protein ABJO01_13755 [Parasphingorhabdus sp.]|uniref:hypothetical protein n=1 Tax=Parasphingorhabdus sp. TaxID=2709688 RepID=UPI003297E0F9